MHLTCMNEKGLEVLAQNIQNKTFIRKNFSDRTQTQYTVEQWS